MKQDNNTLLIKLTELTKPLMDELIKYAYKPNYCEIETRLVKNEVIIDLEYNCKSPNEIAHLIKNCEEYGLKLNITSVQHDSEEVEDLSNHAGYSYSVAAYNSQRNYISYLKIYGSLTAIKGDK